MQPAPHILFAAADTAAAATPAWEWISLGSLAHMLAFALVASHCLRHRREPTSALLWLCVAWFVPFAGPALYFLFGIYRVPEKARDKHRADQRFAEERRTREETGLHMAYWRAVHEATACEPPTAEGRLFNRSLDGLLEEYPLLDGNRVTPLLDGGEAYPIMLEAIRSAKNHIHIQTFILGNDDVGREFMDALAERARAGVAVRLLYDRFGSTHAVWGRFFRHYRGIPNLKIAGWRQVNLLKAQFQLNLRNHRKLLVVDGVRAFTGGLNLHEGHVEGPGRGAIRDYHFDVAGPVVQELQYSFLRDWAYMTGEEPDALFQAAHFPHQPAAGAMPVRVINSGPAIEQETINDVFFMAISSARRELWIVTPYFVPGPDILQALRAAARRGVDVRLIVPRANNHVYAGLAGQALYDDLLACGVRIFEREPPFMHAKAMVMDDTLALVGTANFDIRSLRLNYETNLAVYSAGFVAAMRHLARHEMAASRELALAAWRARPLRRKLLENACSLFTPIL